MEALAVTEIPGIITAEEVNEPLRPPRLIEFMRRLTRDAKRKGVLILDNLNVHEARPVREWLAQHRDEIEVFFLSTNSETAAACAKVLRARGNAVCGVVQLQSRRVNNALEISNVQATLRRRSTGKKS